MLTDPAELLPYESDALAIWRSTPGGVVFVHDTEELQRVVSLLYKNQVPYVARGAGTGLSGGALAEGAVVVELSRMNRVLWLDEENGRARVQPGTVNARLSEAAAPHGLMYAPDPSSQPACTLGGNVAENAGGPHCLKYGVTTNHILGLTIVAPDGELIDLPPDGRPGYDLVGLFVGSEGTLGICSEIEIKLVPIPPAAETLLAHFDDIEAAGRAVSAIIAAGILPTALEMMDVNTIRAVEESVFAAGFPTDVAASLIVELDGPKAGLIDQAGDVDALLKDHGAREVARAKNEADRLRFWKARKSAFGAMGRLSSALVVLDVTVPRSKLPAMLARVYEVAGKYDLKVTNVFHAGDGNMHPNLLFDDRDEEMVERVHAASREILEAGVAVGGTITGEHGVGLDKRKYMTLVYSDDDCQAMGWVKNAFDPRGLCNPGKLLPEESTGRPAEAPGLAPTMPSPKDVASDVGSELGPKCLIKDGAAFQINGERAAVVAAPESVEELSELMKLATDRGWAVVPAGQGGWLANGERMRRADLVISTRRLKADVEHSPDDLLATAQAGVSLSSLNSTLAEGNQWWPIDPLGSGTVGGAIATNAAGPLAAGYGTPRDLVLGLTVVRADGRIVKAGGRVVKNVAGYDMVRLFTGSWGTLGIITEAHLRLHALPQTDETRIFVAGRPEQLAGFANQLGKNGSLMPVAAEIVSPAIADALEMRTGHWRMAVRWLGHERAVEDAIEKAERSTGRESVLVEEGAGAWKMLRALETQVGSILTVRIDVPRGATADVTQRASVFTGSDYPLVQAAPLLGRVWIFVPMSLYDDAKGERLWALRIEDLRRVAAECGGGVRVEEAPFELRRQVDPWGDPGDGQRFNEALKRGFDPGDNLKPGFFTGEL